MLTMSFVITDLQQQLKSVTNFDSPESAISLISIVQINLSFTVSRKLTANFITSKSSSELLSA